MLVTPALVGRVSQRVHRILWASQWLSGNFQGIDATCTPAGCYKRPCRTSTSDAPDAGSTKACSKEAFFSFFGRRLQHGTVEHREEDRRSCTNHGLLLESQMYQDWR